MPPLSLPTSALALRALGAGGAALLDAAGPSSSSFAQQRAPAYAAHLAPGDNVPPSHAASPFSYSAGPALHVLPAAVGWPSIGGEGLRAWQPHADRPGFQHSLAQPPPLEGAGTSPAGPRAEHQRPHAAPHHEQAASTEAGLAPLRWGPHSELAVPSTRAAAAPAAASAGSREAAPTGGSAAPQELQQAGWPNFLL